MFGSISKPSNNISLTCRWNYHCLFLVFPIDYFFTSFYAGDSLRCLRCFRPPVTTYSKKSPRKRHTDTPASFTVLTMLR